MNQPKDKKSKANLVPDDHLSSSEDEMKPRRVGKKSKDKSKAKKTFEKSRPKEKGSKESKKSQVDGKYTDIKLSSYRCMDAAQAPRDAHVVDIDTFGVCCQLWEMYKAKTQIRQNVTQKKAELYAVLCSALAILENIVLGVRYSDIPTLVVEMFPRTRICVRNDYMEVVHACSIPKGKVFIGRGNKSVGYLAAFIDAVNPAAIQDDNSLKIVEANVVNILTNKGFDTPIITPPAEQDECLESLCTHHHGTKYAAQEIILKFRNVMLDANAAVMDETDYQLYVPVLCEQSEICYVISFGGDVQLVSFMPISNETTLQRLKIYAMSFRFFISYTRVMKENKSLLDAESVENAMLDQGYVPIFGKHGIMMLKKRMDEEGRQEDESVLVEEDVSVPMLQEPPGQTEQLQFNFNSGARSVCAKSKKFMSKLELKSFRGKRVKISNDGIVCMETDLGVAYTMVSGKLRGEGLLAKNSWFKSVPENASRKWTTWAAADTEAKVQAWVDDLPVLPDSW